MLRKFILPLLVLTLSAPAVRAAPLYDIMVLIDGSGSVSSPDFILESQLVQTLADGLTLGAADNRIGIVQFGTAAALAQGLSGDAATITNTLASLSQEGGQTNHAAAFTLAGAELALNGRIGAQQVVILLTDGDANQPSGGNPIVDAIVAAESLKSGDALVFAIGFGSSVSFATLENYASAPTGFYAYSADSFELGNPAIASVLAQLASIEAPPVASIDAPAPLALLGLGLAGLGLVRRRRPVAA